MKSLNAKKIAAVVAGAALLGVGLAFAGPVTFQNVPIISNSGQPVVQIVVGSTAKPSDGVAAANIAAAIGNLAYTSVPVTASVNATQAASVLHVTVSSAKYSLANQQVWLNESGSVTSSGTGGTYYFPTLIGSVLNQGVQLGSQQSTKALQGSGSYTFPITPLSTTASPATSPYAPEAGAPIASNPNGQNSGGVLFSSFTSGSTYDNILEVTSAQFSTLKSDWGSNGETEYLWVTGFPVFDQGSSGSLVNQFQLLDAGGAYQLIFNKPIANTLSSGSAQINVPISILDQNYTIINATSGGLSAPTSSSQFKTGGSMYLASTLAPLQTVYVGHNITSGPWEIQLQDLGQPNSNGVSPASVAVYFKGVETNESSISPGSLAKFNVSGNLMYLDVNTTFAGLYSYQKWAKIELYTNVFKLNGNGNQYNSTTNPGWRVNLLWTNTTSTSGSAKANQLYGITIYNSTPTTLSQGQSLSFIENPSVFKLTFLGDTLGAGSYDPVSLTTEAASEWYANNFGAAAGTYSGPGGSITNITEPATLLVVTSQIPGGNAFSFSGGQSDTLTYDLTPFVLNEQANSLTHGGFGSSANGIITGSNAVLTYTDTSTVGGASTTPWINTGSKQLNVLITGYTPSGQSATDSVLFQNNVTSGQTVTNAMVLNTPLYNVTGIAIQGSYVPPIYNGGKLTIQVNSYNTLVSNSGNTVALANLETYTSSGSVGQGVGLLYAQAGQSYQGIQAQSGGQVTYNQQNGEPTSTFTITTASAPSNSPVPHAAWTYKVGEVAVPANTVAVDSLGVGLYNNSVGSSPEFVLNYSASGQHNNVTYTPSTGSSAIAVEAGFRTERGSKVATISPSTVTFDMATAVDELRFEVSSSSSAANTVASHTYTWHGPYTVGQATNIPNVTIAAVNATVQLSGSASYSITGISNITATPSVTSAVTPVWLKNLSTTAPLVVLDSAATNPASSLILVGSGYVNTLSQQLQTSYNVSVTPSSAPITQVYGTNRILVAGYTANQTTQAADTFISELYQNAASST